jgi:hypothetical protein
MTRSVVAFLLAALASPANGVYRLSGGRLYLRDKADGTYRAAVLKDGVLTTTGETL